MSWARRWHPSFLRARSHRTPKVLVAELFVEVLFLALGVNLAARRCGLSGIEGEILRCAPFVCQGKQNDGVTATAAAKAKAKGNGKWHG